ncbi:hypothetical protein R1T08_33915 [Streptomyces sp. SBC-4]|nr:hypothetical protein [Streptomyces sp. SBC-4]MDV5149002.1 hypothetical protein [Streptomyces sp. SBC-4]
MTMPNRGSGRPVAERVDRFVTGGCLALLVVLIVVGGFLAAWMWSSIWRVTQDDGNKREAALAALLQEADRTAADSRHALGASGSTDVDVLTGVIGQRTGAPVITYDASRDEFTAVVRKEVRYDMAGFTGAGAGEEARCLVLTYTRGAGRTWTSRVDVQDVGVCGPSREIDVRAAEARAQLAGTPAEDLTASGVQRSLDPAGRPDWLRVTRVVRRGDVVTVSAVVSTWDGSTGQCYRFTRRLSGAGAPSAPATGVPALRC